jgi:hypothetical protein
MRVDVIKLDEGPLVAPSPVLADEGACALVTRKDRSPDLGRDIPAAGSRTPTGPRPLGRGELSPGQLLEEHRQRPIDDFGQVSTGDGVSQQVLSLAQLLSRLGARREPYLIAVWRERPDERSASRWQ